MPPAIMHYIHLFRHVSLVLRALNLQQVSSVAGSREFRMERQNCQVMQDLDKGPLYLCFGLPPDSCQDVSDALLRTADDGKFGHPDVF